MKDTSFNLTERQLTNMKAIRQKYTLDLNKSELTTEDYGYLLRDEFSKDLKEFTVDENEYMYRDGYIVFNLKSCLATIKSVADTLKKSISGYKIILFKDNIGFGFEFIIYPINNNEPIDSVTANRVENYFDCFLTSKIEEEFRTVFIITPNCCTQFNLLLPENIPVFATSLTLSMNPTSKDFEIISMNNEIDRINPDGAYKWRRFISPS